MSKLGAKTEGEGVMCRANRFTIKRIALRFLLTGGLMLLSARQLNAHQSPSNCLVIALGLDVIKRAPIITNGGSVNLTVQVFNPTSTTVTNGCDITGATVTLTCSAADGTPTGATTT